MEENVFNAKEVERIVQEGRWPSLPCEVCGGSHVAAIRKIRDTEQGGAYEFLPAECPNPTGE